MRARRARRRAGRTRRLANRLLRTDDDRIMAGDNRAWENKPGENPGDDAVRFPDPPPESAAGPRGAGLAGRRPRRPSASAALTRAVIVDALGEAALAARPGAPGAAARAALGRTAAAGPADVDAAWRHGYPAAFRALVAAGLADDAAAVEIARRGLDALDARLGLDLRAAGRLPTGEPMPAIAAVGSSPPSRAVVVPYRGQLLHGDALHRQLDAWLASGSMEPAAAEGIRAVDANPDWLDLSDLTFALIGAGAQMGPLGPLLAWGAEVIAVDVPAPAVWSRVHRAANISAGRVHMLTADVAAHPGRVGRALAERDLRGRRMVLGNYLYAPGSAYLLASAAADAVIAHVLRERDDTAIAALGSPTEVYAVPAEVVAAARDAARRWGPLRVGGPMARAATARRLALPQYPLDDPDAAPDAQSGGAAGITDSMVMQQGPSYAMAKQVQRWRMAVARADGVDVSFNVAPPSRTGSVLSHRLLRAAYDGASRFGVEIFDPATSNALMAALLVRDVRQPPRRDRVWRHESSAAVHGGLWRQGYVPRSVLGLAVGFGAPSLLRR